MQITFDTTTITDDEVRGIFALLDTVRPEALAVEEPEWTGVKITKRADTHEEVSREPVEETADKGGEAGPSETVATLDSTGLPWHPDIHASSKALNADGTWRTKRGVDKALVAKVEAELRGAQTPAAVQLVQHDRTGEPAPEGVETSEAPVDAYISTTHIAPPPAPPAPSAPTPYTAEHAEQTTVPVPPVDPAPVVGVSPFVALMKRVTTAQGAGKLTQPRVKELLESLDKKSIMDLRTDEDALASFAVLLDGEGV